MQALVGEGSGEELLCSSENSLMNDSILYEPDRSLQKFKPRIDKHPKWLHLRIRPSNLSFRDSSKYDAFTKGKPKVLVEGRWTLAFCDEQSCKLAESMIIEERNLQCTEVERRLKPFLDLDTPGYAPDCSYKPFVEPPVQ